MVWTYLAVHASASSVKLNIRENYFYGWESVFILCDSCWIMYLTCTRKCLIREFYYPQRVFCLRMGNWGSSYVAAIEGLDGL